MPRLNRKLTDTEIRNAKPRERNYCLYDDGALKLLIRKSGTKSWLYVYTVKGRKRNLCTLGQYPEMSAAQARTARDTARALVRKGIDPNQHKREQLIETTYTFERVAREWHGQRPREAKYARSILLALERDVFPKIGNMPLSQIRPQDIITILRTIEARGALEAAKRTIQFCEAIFNYAIMACLYDKNPAMGRSSLVKARKVQHRAYLTESQLPGFLDKLDNYKVRGRGLAPLALKLLLLTFVRPGELLNARWVEFNLERAEWIIPSERMKMRRPHIVPLSTQAIKVLEIIKPLAGESRFVFPSRYVWRKPMSASFFKQHLVKMGHIGENKFVPHGARATASTILNERGNFRPDVIERQLAHVERNKVRAAYHRAEYLDDRKAMMQWWGDYLDNCRKQAKLNS